MTLAARSWSSCDECRGTGRVHVMRAGGLTPHSYEACRACRGTGLIEIRESKKPSTYREVGPGPSPGETPHRADVLPDGAGRRSPLPRMAVEEG